MRFRSASALLTAVLLAAAPVSLPFSATAAPAVVQAAEEPITWSVKPADSTAGPRPTFEYSNNPGLQIEDNVVIVNSGNVTATFEIYGTDATNDFDTGGLSLLPADQAPVDLGSWIVTDVSEVRLEPNTQATVPFKILVPSDASPGDHSAGIVASTTTVGEDGDQAVVVDQRVGARVNMRVSGPVTVDVEPAGLVTGFAPSWVPFVPGTMSVDYAVTNNGNIRVDVVQDITIVGPFGIQLGTIAARPVENLLPGQATQVTADVSGVGALLLAWTDVTLTPGPAGSAAAPANDPDAVADPAAPVEETVDPNAAIDFSPITTNSIAIAVSWTGLVLIVLLVGIAFLVNRYVRNIRENMYLAIEEARENAARDSDQIAAADARETVTTR